jgi:hypothetical protein
MQVQRRRFKQKLPLQERLTLFAEAVRKQASILQPGAEKDQLLFKARQADSAAHLDEWVNSPGLQPPK